MAAFVNSKIFKVGELFFFYILLPFLVDQKVFGGGQFGKGIPLIITCIIFLVVLLKSKGYKNKNLIKFSKDYDWSKALLRFLIIAVIAFLFVYFFHNDLLFHFADEKPERYLLFLVIYPVVSVIPQEIVYRGYFFYRYKSIFPNIKIMGIINAILFGYLHFIYDNWLAVIGAALVGIVFIINYLKTKSLMNVAIEHYAYGILIFTLGLGKFFK